MSDFLKNICTKYGLSRQFIKFLLVGILNTAFGYSVYSICIFAGLHYTIAALLTTIIGILFNFKTTGNIVFKNNNNKLLAKFILVYAAAYFLTIICMKILTLFGITNMYVNYALVLPINVIFSYTLMKKFVFV